MSDDIKTISEVTDQYDYLDREEQALTKRLNEIKDEKKALGHRAFHLLNEVGAEKMRAGLFDVMIEQKRAYKAASWEEFYNWLITNRRTDALHKRLSVTVLDDIYASEGELPPGIEHNEYRDVKFKRVSKVNTLTHTGAKAA